MRKSVKDLQDFFRGLNMGKAGANAIAQFVVISRLYYFYLEILRARKGSNSMQFPQSPMAPRERYSAKPASRHLKNIIFFSLLCRCSPHFPHGFFQHGPYKVLFQRHVTMFAAVQHQTQISFECRPRLSDLSVSYKFSLSRVQFPHWFCSKGRVRVQRSD